MIKLAPISPADFPKLISWAVSKEFLIQWTGRTFTYPLDEKQLTEYYQLTLGKNPKRRILKAVDEENENHIGNITIDWAKSAEGEAALTCIIVGDSNYLGKGVGQFMVKESAGIAINELNKRKIFLNVFEFNSGAIRCYEKCGFEKVLQEKITIDGKEYINIRMELDYRKWNAAGWLPSDMLKDTSGTDATKL